MMNDLDIVQIRNTVKSEVMAKPEVLNELARNTFKGLKPENIPLALVEGMMRGYSIQDFITKKIYATPFWNKKAGKQQYALVQSIADVRTIAMNAGQSGKSSPEYEFKEDKKPLSCSITVWRKGGDERGYSAKVFFDEYNTGENLWSAKPLTMIAKVAEMHALRMAFPEKLSEAFIEEEFEKEAVVVNAQNQDLTIHQEAIAKIENQEDLKKYWEENKGLGKEFGELITIRKDQLEEASKNKTENENS